jgi:acyl dehydratase
MSERPLMQPPPVIDTWFEDVCVGEEIPAICIGPLSHTQFVFIASSHHDWYPGHHDVEYARAQGLPDIFMNATWQHGFLQRLLCAWAGPNAIPRRIRYRMGRPVVRHDVVHARGRVTGKRIENGEHLVDLDVWLDKQDAEKVTTGSATVVLASRGDAH